MTNTKKQAKKQAKSAIPYLQRLMEDRYVQEQLLSAAAGVRGAYARVRRQGTQAASDKKLYGNLRHAAASIRNAATMLQRPKPQPKRRVQKLVAAGLAGGSALLVVKQQKARSGSNDTAATSSAPGDPTTRATHQKTAATSGA